MKKTVIFLVVIFFASFGFCNILESDYLFLVNLADKCIEEEVFYEEMFSLTDGVVWGDAVFIPITVLNKLSIASGWGDAFGVMIIRLRDTAGKDGLFIVEIEEIEVSGKNKRGETVSNQWSTLYVLFPNAFVKTGYYQHYLATSERYLVLLLEEDLDTSSDFIVDMSTKTSKGNWKVRLNSREFATLKELVRSEN